MNAYPISNKRMRYGMHSVATSTVCSLSVAHITTWVVRMAPTVKTRLFGISHHNKSKRAQIPATKEPANLILQNGKGPDGSTLIPRSRGKPVACDVTVLQTLMQNHTLATLPQRQVQRRTRQQPTKSPSTMNWPARASSTQLP